jgi:hypothetical protein
MTLPDAVPMTTAQLWLTEIPVIISSLATLIVAWTGLSTLKKNQTAAATKADNAATNAAVQVEKVKTDLVTANNQLGSKLESIQQISDDTHVLVNNAMSQQLRITAEKSRQVADLTKDPVDILEAEAAEAALKSHLEKQARVDYAMQARVNANEVAVKNK